MQAATRLAEVNSSLRLAHWFAQLGHESGSLRWVSELWGPTPAQRRYEPQFQLGRRLGNIRPGDGSRYRGRGLIQVTGRENYRAATRRLKKLFGESVPDFEKQPQLLALKEWAAISAADYWMSRRLNQYCDEDDSLTLTKRINGGLNGYADRLNRLAKAKGILQEFDHV